MNMKQTLMYHNTEYSILAVEQEFIIHPIALGFLPFSSASLQCSFSAQFILKEYKLLLNSLEIGFNESTSLGGIHMEGYSQNYSFGELPIGFSGAILIGTDLQKEYHLDQEAPAYFSYQKLMELIFENGILITTVDQSRAMLRIRKNLELGLRSLSVKRDKNCINRFMNSVLVGDYKAFHFHYNRMKYVKEMKKDYSVANLYKYM